MAGGSEKGGEDRKAEVEIVVIGRDRKTSLDCREDLGCYPG